MSTSGDPARGLLDDLPVRDLWVKWRNDPSIQKQCWLRYADAKGPLPQYDVTRSHFERYLVEELAGDPTEYDQGLEYVQQHGPVCGDCLDEQGVSYEDWIEEFALTWDGNHPYLDQEETYVLPGGASMELNGERFDAPPDAAATSIIIRYCSDHPDQHVTVREFVAADEIDQFEQALQEHGTDLPDHVTDA